MQSTYSNFKELSTLHNGSEDINTLALQYQQTEDPIILAFVFCRNYPLILTIVEKYFYLTNEEKASFAVEELHKSMKDFKTTGGAKLVTFFSRYLNNRLRAETWVLSHDKRCANNSADSYEVVSVNMNETIKNDFTTEIELLTTFESSGVFTCNELKYCKIIMKTNCKLTDSDIANELNVSPSAIHQMKKSIKKKFLSLSVSYA